MGRRWSLSPLDGFSLAFVLVMTTALARLWPPEAVWIVTAHVLLTVAIVLAPLARHAGGCGALLGNFYPLAVDWALYAEVGLLNRARGISHDALVQRWEQALVGTQVAQEWMAAWPSPVVSTILHL